MFSLRACVAVGVVGLLACSVLVGVSFSSIQSFLFNLNLEALVALPSFYSFVISFVGFGGSIGLILKKPSSSSAFKANFVSSKPKPSVSSEKESSGTSPFMALMAGTLFQNSAGSSAIHFKIDESGTALELVEDIVSWPKFAKVDVPEEPKKQVVAKRRFFERVED